MGNSEGWGCWIIGFLFFGCGGSDEGFFVGLSARGGMLLLGDWPLLGRIFAHLVRFGHHRRPRHCTIIPHSHRQTPQ